MSNISAMSNRETFRARIRRYISYLQYLDTTDCSETAYLSDRVKLLESQVAELKADFTKSGPRGNHKNDEPNTQ